MVVSGFDDKKNMPQEELLVRTLGVNKGVWDELLAHITAVYPAVVSEWKFYSKAAGWTLVVKSRKRTLIYLLPQEGYFKVNLVFGGKAVQQAQEAALPAAVLEVILAAKTYQEGRPFMLAIRTATDLQPVQQLLAIKNSVV